MCDLKFAGQTPDGSPSAASEEPPIAVLEVPVEAAEAELPRGRGSAPIFVATAFLGSSLLFLVQPMVAKALLPSLGGTPSVWNTSMVFFQVALVLGYAVAHGGMRLLAPRRERQLQVAALALPVLTLPVALPGGWEPPVTGSPTGWVLLALAVMVGAPFLALSTCSPTLQHWFATSRGTAGRDPYFLYAAGNAGSLLALLAYPVLVEPHLDLDGQARLFTLGYVALVVLVAACALRGHVPPVAPEAAEVAGGDRPVTWADRSRWLAWSLVPSSLLLGVTRHLTTDVMSVPMLWILPLTLYLLTFILAFGRRPERLVRIGARGLQLAALPLVLPVFGVSASLVLVAGLHLVAFFFAALLGHGRLAASRPAPSHLTEFYLVVSIGGAVGGAVTSLLAPVVFPTVVEYPLAIVAALAMCPGALGAAARRRGDLFARAVTPAAAIAGVLAVAVVVRSTGHPRALATTALFVLLTVAIATYGARSPKAFAAGVAILFAGTVLPSARTLVTERSFFGVTRVEVDDQGRHRLMSGTTLHGLQDVDGPDPQRPLVYYSPPGPIGQWFTGARPDRPMEVGAIGMGSGALAGYGRAGDHFTYFEIDPAVVRIARDPRWFTFLDRSAADVDVVLGDGRLTLARSRSTFDTIVLDAFSSDAIPVHLLTREAFGGYLDRLGPGGVIAVHITNRYFDLEPVLARTAADLGLVGTVNRYTPSAAERRDDGAEHTVWVLLAREAADLRGLDARPGWQPLDPAGRGPAWTDSFSNVLDVLDPR